MRRIRAIKKAGKRRGYVLSYLVFDCDDTLYPRGSGLMQAISERISLYMIERMGMDPEIVPGLRRAYWEQYGTTSRGLQAVYGLDVDEYMHYVHDLPLQEYILPDLALDAVLDALPQHKVVFTNATVEHARAVLDVVGVSHHFEGIYDAFFLRNEGKPAPGGYRRLLDALGVQGENCLFAEDTARNLRPAKALGMVTVLVDPLPGDDVDGADFVIERIADIGQVVEKVGRDGDGEWVSFRTV
jgi:putative hydrolase of the HAD superfamily